MSDKSNIGVFVVEELVPHFAPPRVHRGVNTLNPRAYVVVAVLDKGHVNAGVVRVMRQNHLFALFFRKRIAHTARLIGRANENQHKLRVF